MKATPLAVWIPAIAALFSIPLIASFVSTAIAERQWQAAKAEAVAANVPLDMRSALNGYAPGPPAQNAAEGVKAVLRSILEKSRPGSTEFQPPWKAPYKEAKNTIDEEFTRASKAEDQPNPMVLMMHLRSFEAPLHQYDRAIDLPDWNFDRPWHLGLAMLLPDFAHIKSICKLLGARAIAAAYLGDKKLALRSIRSLIRTGNHLQTEPSLIGALVGVSCQNIAYQAALDIVRIRPTDFAFNAEVRKIIESELVEVDWRRIWSADSVMMIESLDDFTTQEGLRNLGYKDDDRVGPKSRRQMLETKAQIARVLTKANKVWTQEPTEEAAVERISREFGNELADIYGSFDDVISSLSGPADAFQNLLKARGELEARRRLTCLALDALRNGDKPPSSMSSPDWQDPFTSKPFKFKREQKGFLIYSIGPDLVDDGGVKGSGDEPRDIVVQFP